MIGQGQDACVRLDHVSYAVSNSEMADTVQRLGAELRAPFFDGGRHPRFGTRNFILPLAGGRYLEVVSALDHPAAESAAFGRAVKARAELGGGWLGWVVAVDDITEVENRLGRNAVDGHRVRPDGFDLTWKQIGINELNEDPSVPYFVQWTVPADQHPSAAASGAVGIVGCEIAGDVDRIRDALGGPIDSPVDSADIDWVDAEEPGLQAVLFRTSQGVVRID